LIPVVIFMIIYFTVIKKKMCFGDVHHCPAANIDICVASGTSDAQWQNLCPITGGGGFGGMGWSSSVIKI
jgi:hypothetical protein